VEVIAESETSNVVLFREAPVVVNLSSASICCITMSQAFCARLSEALDSLESVSMMEWEVDQSWKRED
jgi:hypothetical protein